VNFCNDTFVAFAFVVDENLEQVKYGYHDRDVEGIDPPQGQRHVDRGQEDMPRIHRESNRPHVLEPFAEGDVEEALAEVAEYLRSDVT
jgi:hypothetical protein